MPVRGVRIRRISEIFLYSLIVYSCEERNIAKTLLFQTVTRIVYCFAKVPISSRNQHPPRLAILESTFASSMPSVSKSVKIVFAFSQCCDILQNALLRDPPSATQAFSPAHILRSAAMPPFGAQTKMAARLRGKPLTTDSHVMYEWQKSYLTP